MTPSDIGLITTSKFNSALHSHNCMREICHNSKPHAGSGGMSSASPGATSDRPSNFLPSGNNTGADVGLAIVIPLLLVIFAVAIVVVVILFVMYYKRLRRSKPVGELYVYITSYLVSEKV